MWYICEKWDSKVRENMETERLGNDIPRTGRHCSQIEEDRGRRHPMSLVLTRGERREKASVVGDLGRESGWFCTPLG